MKTKLQKIGSNYAVLLPRQAIEHLRIEEGSELTLRETSSGIEISTYDPESSAQLAAFRRTQPRHRNSYRKLAE